jgi:hypothetical protein
MRERGLIGPKYLSGRKTLRWDFSEVTLLTSNALSREAQLLQDVRVTRVVAQALQTRVNL